MSAAEVAIGLALAVVIGLLTRGAVRRHQTGEVADTPPVSAPLLGVVPPPRSGTGLDDRVTRP